MLPLKWRIFRVINTLHIVGSCAFFTMIMYWTYPLRFANAFDILAFLLLTIGLTSLLVNGIFNILLLEKYYPDKYPSGSFLNFSTLLYIMAILTIIALVVLTTWISIEFWSRERSSYYNPLRVRQVMIMALCFTIVLTGIYVISLQLHLRKTIRRNHIAMVEGFLDTENTP
ncbi:MAG: hypothetical protein QM731_14205 [Chitinophagaceae bacterium]